MSSLSQSFDLADISGSKVGLSTTPPSINPWGDKFIKPTGVLVLEFFKAGNFPKPHDKAPKYYDFDMERLHLLDKMVVVHLAFGSATQAYCSLWFDVVSVHASLVISISCF